MFQLGFCCKGSVKVLPGSFDSRLHLSAIACADASSLKLVAGSYMDSGGLQTLLLYLVQSAALY